MFSSHFPLIEDSVSKNYLLGPAELAKGTNFIQSLLSDSITMKISWFALFFHICFKCSKIVHEGRRG